MMRKLSRVLSCALITAIILLALGTIRDQYPACQQKTVLTQKWEHKDPSLMVERNIEGAGEPRYLTTLNGKIYVLREVLHYDSKTITYSICAIDTGSGNIVSEVELLDGNCAESDLLVMSDDALYFCYSKDAVISLVKYDLSKKTKLWQYTFKDYTLANKIEVANNHAVIFKEADQEDPPTICLDATTGKPLWEAKDIIPGTASRPTIANGKIYLITVCSEVYCLDLATGAILWRTVLPDGDSITSAQIQAYKGRVYVISTEHFYGLDAKTGKVKYKRGIRESTFSPFSINFLIAGYPLSYNGVFAIDPKTNTAIVPFSNTGSMVYDLFTGWTTREYRPFWYSTGKKISRFFLMKGSWGIISGKESAKWRDDGISMNWDTTRLTTPVILKRYIIAIVNGNLIVFDRKTGCPVQRIKGNFRKLVYDKGVVYLLESATTQYNYKTKEIYKEGVNSVSAYTVKE